MCIFVFTKEKQCVYVQFFMLANLLTYLKAILHIFSYFVISDPYHILERDEGELVDSILKDLLKKDFVSDGFVKKLTERDELTGVDPRTKMALRHAQVDDGLRSIMFGSVRKGVL